MRQNYVLKRGWEINNLFK